jgi:hypothetical protein
MADVSFAGDIVIILFINKAKGKTNRTSSPHLESIASPAENDLTGEDVIKTFLPQFSIISYHAIPPMWPMCKTLNANRILFM